MHSVLDWVPAEPKGDGAPAPGIFRLVAIGELVGYKP
jgi:hypothetical protein